MKNILFYKSEIWCMYPNRRGESVIFLLHLQRYILCDKVLNATLHTCPREHLLLSLSPAFSSVGFACIVKWDWWKHPGHYSLHCLANFCALTSTKMSSRSSRLTLASPETINPLAGVVPACTSSPGSERCQQTAVPSPFCLLSIYFGSESVPITNKIWLQ